MKILLTSHSSLIGHELITRLGVRHEIFHLVSNKVDSYNFILWENLDQFEFELILIIDSPSLHSLTDGNYENFLRLNTQAMLLNRYARKHPDTKLIIFSSVSVLGNVAVVDTLIQNSINPNIYGVAKFTQEQIILFNLKNPKCALLRLPAVLMAKAITHFPSRVKDSLKADRPITVYNPRSSWNACIHIDDLVTLVESLINNFPGKCQVFYPHASGELSFENVVYSMKSYLNSQSKILITNDKIDFTGVRKIKLSNLIETKSVEDSLKFFCLI